MATPLVASHASPLVALRHAFSRVFATIGAVLTAIAEANARRTAWERLSALSDAQLAARGLTRADIAAYVFSDRFHI